MLSKTLGQEGYNMSLNQEEEEYIERLYRELKKLYKILFELRVLSQMD